MHKLGCPQAKSFIIKYPNWLDPKLNKHFIRGMVDGDGCITYRKKQNEWKWDLVSTKEGCESIQKIMYNEIGFEPHIGYLSQTNNNTYILMQGGNEKVLKIAEWLYKDSLHSARLDRKYQKYLDLKKQQEDYKI